MDCSPPGPSAHGILQARMLEWVAVPSSRGSSQPSIKPTSPALDGGLLTTEPPGKPIIRGLTWNKYCFLFLPLLWSLLWRKKMTWIKAPFWIHTQIQYKLKLQLTLKTLKKWVPSCFNPCFCHSPANNTNCVPNAVFFPAFSDVNISPLSHICEHDRWKKTRHVTLVKAQTAFLPHPQRIWCSRVRSPEFTSLTNPVKFTRQASKERLNWRAAKINAKPTCCCQTNILISLQFPSQSRTQVLNVRALVVRWKHCQNQQLHHSVLEIKMIFLCILS